MPSGNLSVYVDVVCDLFHMGHVEFFKQAKSLGDRLIVGLVSDADAATYKAKPILTFEERREVVRACRYVDQVLEEPAPLQCTRDFLDSIGADLCCHGDDFSEAELQFWYRDLMSTGRLKIVIYTKGISTRQILNRIASRMENRPEVSKP